jgi:hypothetical protein
VEQDANLAALRGIIVATFPELVLARFKLHAAGWDSFAVDVDDRLIFKFPRHAAAETRLRSEAGLLAAARPAVSMRLPDQQLHLGPPLFSRHEKLKGEHLLAAQYARLPSKARARLAADMALFFAELHAIDDRRMAAAGAGPIGTWLPPDEILRQAWPLLPHELRGYALHQEFMHPNWISPDLTERIITEYEVLTGRTIDRERVALLSGVLRLSELGGSDPVRAASVVKSVADWAVYQEALPVRPTQERRS